MGETVYTGVCELVKPVLGVGGAGDQRMVQVASAGGIHTTSAVPRGEVAAHQPDSLILELALGSWELRPHLKTPAFYAQE